MNEQEFWKNRGFGVFYASNSEAFYMLAVSLLSLRDAHQKYSNPTEGKLGVCVMHSNLTPQEIKELTDLFDGSLDFWFLDLSDSYNDLHANTMIGKESFYRLSVPDLTPIGKSSIYLDTDTLVLGDISQLVVPDELGEGIGAVPETNVASLVKLGVRLPEVFDNLKIEEYLRDALSLESDQYIQAGVLVFRNVNLLMRAQISLARQLSSEHFFWMDDQTILSKVLGGNFYRLEPAWNIQVGDRLNRNRIQTLKGVHVLHYSGLFRPWRILFHGSFRIYSEYEILLPPVIRKRRPSGSFYEKVVNQAGLAGYRSLPAGLRRLVWKMWTGKKYV